MAECKYSLKLIRKNGKPGATLPLTASTYRFGGDNDCEVKIKIDGVQDKHMVFTAAKGELLLEAFGSGVGINDEEVVLNAPVKLQHNDLVNIFHRKFKIVDNALCPRTPKKRSVRAKSMATVQHDKENADLNSALAVASANADANVVAPSASSKLRRPKAKSMMVQNAAVQPSPPAPVAASEGDVTPAKAEAEAVPVEAEAVPVETEAVPMEAEAAPVPVATPATPTQFPEEAFPVTPEEVSAAVHADGSAKKTRRKYKPVVSQTPQHPKAAVDRRLRQHVLTTAAGDMALTGNAISSMQYKRKRGAVKAAPAEAVVEEPVQRRRPVISETPGRPKKRTHDKTLSTRAGVVPIRHGAIFGGASGGRKAGKKSALRAVQAEISAIVEDLVTSEAEEETAEPMDAESKATPPVTPAVTPKRATRMRAAVVSATPQPPAAKRRRQQTTTSHNAGDIALRHNALNCFGGPKKVRLEEPKPEKTTRTTYKKPVSSTPHPRRTTKRARRMHGALTSCAGDIAIRRHGLAGKPAPPPKVAEVQPEEEPTPVETVPRKATPIAVKPKANIKNGGMSKTPHPAAHRSNRDRTMSTRAGVVPFRHALFNNGGKKTRLATCLGGAAAAAAAITPAAEVVQEEPVAPSPGPTPSVTPVRKARRVHRSKALTPQRAAKRSGRPRTASTVHGDLHGYTLQELRDMKALLIIADDSDHDVSVVEEVGPTDQADEDETEGSVASIEEGDGPQLEYERNELEGLKRKQLFALCRKHDIPCKGTNATLVDALAAVEREEAASAPEEAVEEPALVEEPAPAVEVSTKKTATNRRKSKKAAAAVAVEEKPQVAPKRRGRKARKADVPAVEESPAQEAEETPAKEAEEHSQEAELDVPQAAEEEAVLEATEGAGYAVNGRVYTAEELAALKRKEIFRLCKELGIPCKGTSAALVDAIKEQAVVAAGDVAEDQEPQEQQEAAPSPQPPKKRRRVTLKATAKVEVAPEEVQKPAPRSKRGRRAGQAVETSEEPAAPEPTTAPPTTKARRGRPAKRDDSTTTKKSATTTRTSRKRGREVSGEPVVAEPAPAKRSRRSTRAAETTEVEEERAKPRASRATAAKNVSQA
eukprot:CAMPEP_0119156456 /NCGR_PEP_ID=MMETSP1310-20130426/52263_1 /TAXON_ID=464262 /ORGANISM="Genus nov. species nov., Strain RCC2339" /LENGTH=1102 /DNA_ID=CAMNT_0007149069 /DNA_START=133 /DNA_END=3438 /DNA_ORIENTATION=-